MSACHCFCFASAMCLEGFQFPDQGLNPAMVESHRILTLDHQRIPGLVLFNSLSYLLEFILNDWVLIEGLGRFQTLLVRIQLRD